jgi:L-amino acid N-acyltransferase YncA
MQSREYEETLKTAAKVVVAVQDETIIGGGQAGRFATTNAAEGFADCIWYLSSIVVQAEARNRGVGKAVVKELCAQAAKDNSVAAVRRG